MKAPVGLLSDRTVLRQQDGNLALTRLMYDTRMSWGMKFAGKV